MWDSYSEHMLPIGDSQIWTTVSGHGRPVVMFNGGPGCDDYLEPVARLLDDRCRVIRFEPRGCGRSSWDGRYDVQTFVDDAEAIRHAYRIERRVVLGHSHGPNLALAYALRYPAQTLGIIGIAGGKIVNDRDWSAVYQERLASIGEDLGGKIFHADPEVNRQGNASWRCYCQRPTLLRELADLQIPCVFINATEDIRPNWPTQQLAALLPHGHYQEIAGAAHSIWLAHAAELQQALCTALAIIDRGASGVSRTTSD